MPHFSTRQLQGFAGVFTLVVVTILLVFLPSSSNGQPVSSNAASSTVTIKSDQNSTTLTGGNNGQSDTPFVTTTRHVETDEVVCNVTSHADGSLSIRTLNEGVAYVSPYLGVPKAGVAYVFEFDETYVGANGVRFDKEGFPLDDFDWSTVAVSSMQIDTTPITADEVQSCEESDPDR